MTTYLVWFTVGGERRRLGVRLTSEAEACQWAQRLEADPDVSEVQVEKAGG